MRSFSVISGEDALAQQFINLRRDAAGAGNLLAHQQLGYFTLSTNPTNTKTLTLDINGTNVVFTFVTSIGTTAGNVLIGASAAATAANLLALLNQPQTTTTTGVALSGANQSLVSYLSYSLSGTTLTVSSNNNGLYAPLTSFSGSTNATSDSYTAQTMQLYVEPGVVYVNGTRVIFAGGSTPTVTAPSSHPRIDVLTIDNTGTLGWTTGTEASSPSAPTYPADKIALCELYNVVGETALYDTDDQQSNQGYIYNDVRPVLGLPFNPAAISDTLLPAADNTYNLGSASFEWGSIYAKTGIFVNNVGVATAKFGGTGSDGSLSISSGTTTASGISSGYLEKNYTSISVTGTAVLAFSTLDTTRGTLVALRSQGGVTLTSSATRLIDLRSAGGGTDGSPGSSGTGAGGGGGGGGGGGSSAGAGTSGSPNSSADYTAGGAGGAGHGPLNQFAMPRPGGNGGAGGNGGGTGGAAVLGGGALYVECFGAYNCTGTIDVSGAGGNSGSSSGGGSGGGAGGNILVLYGSLTADSGTYTTTGGSGGSGSGSSGSGGNAANGTALRITNTSRS